MDSGNITESLGGGTSVDIGMVAVAVALVALAMVLVVVGGLVGYRRSRGSIERAFSAFTSLSGVALLATVLLTGFEILPEAAFWPLIIFRLALWGLLFWSWMLIDCALKELSTGNDKLVWVIIILFAQVFGAVLYLLVRRPRRLVEVGR